MNDEKVEVNWTAVTARCLAYLCLKKWDSEHADAPLFERAQFLAALGVPPPDRAAMVGSSVDSLRVLGRIAKRKKTAKKGVRRNGR